MSDTIECFEATTGHVMISNTGGPSKVIAPGERHPVDRSLPSHQALIDALEAGADRKVKIVDVDPEAEQRNEKARQKLLAQLDEVQQAEQDEAQQRARVAAGEGIYSPEEYNVADVLGYLRQASPEEVARVQALEASSDRASKQIADYELKEE